MMVNNDPAKYSLNNIRFRISSCKTVSEYKDAQSFLLTEMEFGQYKFSKTSKELALLQSDTMFKTMLLIEKHLIDFKGSEINEASTNKMFEIIADRLGYMDEVVSLHKDIFSEKYIQVWRGVHFDTESIVGQILDAAEGKSSLSFFKELSAIFMDILDKIRYELYEIDYLINGGEKPFLIVSDLCLYADIFSEEDMLLKKGKVYVKEFNVTRPFLLQNYTSSYATFAKCTKNIISSDIPTLDIV